MTALVCLLTVCSPAVTAGPHPAFALEPVFSLLEREA